MRDACITRSGISWYRNNAESPIRHKTCSDSKQLWNPFTMNANCKIRWCGQHAKKASTWTLKLMVDQALLTKTSPIILSNSLMWQSRFWCCIRPTTTYSTRFYNQQSSEVLHFPDSIYKGPDSSSSCKSCGMTFKDDTMGHISYNIDIFHRGLVYHRQNRFGSTNFFVVPSAEWSALRRWWGEGADDHPSFIWQFENFYSHRNNLISQNVWYLLPEVAHRNDSCKVVSLMHCLCFNFCECLAVARRISFTCPFTCLATTCTRPQRTIKRPGRHWKRLCRDFKPLARRFGKDGESLRQEVRDNQDLNCWKNATLLVAFIQWTIHDSSAFCSLGYVESPHLSLRVWLIFQHFLNSASESFGPYSWHDIYICNDQHRDIHWYPNKKVWKHKCFG